MRVKGQPGLEPTASMAVIVCSGVLPASRVRPDSIAPGDLLRVQRLARLAQDVDRDLLRRLALAGWLFRHVAGLLLLPVKRLVP
jgi:hypothetical protein